MTFAECQERYAGGGGSSGLLAPVVVATTGNIDVATGGIPEDSLTDGVTVEVGQRILVWQQDDSNEIGIYIVQADAWTRAPDFPAIDFNVPPFGAPAIFDGVMVATGSQGSTFSGAMFAFGNELQAFVPVVGGFVQAAFNYTIEGGLEEAQIVVETAKNIAPGGHVVLPDSDPHVAGAGYWVTGVLTRSAG